MANWMEVEGKLSDGLPMRLYLAEHEGRIWAASLHDDVHRKGEEEFLHSLGNPRAWQRWYGGSGSGLLDAAEMQVLDYFAGRQLTFDLPLEFCGTTFQVQVWRELQRIPFGETRSYGDIAEAIGKGSAVRAVGGANGKNNLPLLIPCHRVIAAGGKLGGFTGGLGLKKRLLAHEAFVLRQRRAA